MTTLTARLLTRPVFLFILFISAFIARGQVTTAPDPVNTYGPGTTITTTVTSDQTGTEITVREYKDKDGVLKKRQVQRRNIRNERVDSTEEYSAGGRVLSLEILQVNPQGLTVYWEVKRTPQKGQPTVWVRNTYTNYPDGSFDEHSVNVRTGKETKRHQPPSARPSADSIPFLDIFGCIPKTQGHIGYSYLNVGYGSERESFPIGINASFNYNFKPSWGAIADLSYHTKKDEDYGYNNIYFGVGVQFSDSKGDCEKKVHPFGNFLVGFMYDSYSYDGEKLNDQFSFSGLLGGGVNIDIGTNTGIKMQAHYVPVFNDGVSHNFRIGAGLFYTFSGPPAP